MRFALCLFYKISSPALSTSWPKEGPLPAIGTLYHRSLWKKVFDWTADCKHDPKYCSPSTWTTAGHSVLGMIWQKKYTLNFYMWKCIICRDLYVRANLLGGCLFCLVHLSQVSDFPTVKKIRRSIISGPETVNVMEEIYKQKSESIIWYYQLLDSRSPFN